MAKIKFTVVEKFLNEYEIEYDESKYTEKEVMEAVLCNPWFNGLDVSFVQTIEAYDIQEDTIQIKKN